MNVPGNDATSLLKLLLDIGRELATTLDLQVVLSRVLFLSIGNVGAERGTLIVLDDEQEPVHAAIVYNGQLLPYTVEQLREVVDRGLAGWVLRNRKPALLNDTSKDPRWVLRPDDDVRQTGAKSAICVPLMARERLVGVLTIVHSQPGSFSPMHLELLQAIADQAGMAVHNAQLYDSLEAVHRRYHDLFEDSIDPILITDLQGRILEANRQAALASGTDANRLTQMHVSELRDIPPAWLDENLPRLKDGETLALETVLERPGRSSLPVEIHVRQVRPGKDEEVIQWILRDISARKELDGMRNDLSAMIYHDLRSPLANIISSIDVLSTMLPPESAAPMRPLFQISIRSADRMQRLISSLLDINRLEQGQAIANPKPMQMRDLVYDALETLQPIIESNHQTLAIQLPADLPPVWVDNDMIRRVIINLLENASKFTPTGGQLSVQAARVDDRVRVDVRDTGPGIPAAAREKIFDKFARLQSDRGPKGLGLGLAFCRLAVQAHGGKIWVESEPGQGSCFSFTLPTSDPA